MILDAKNRTCFAMCATLMSGALLEQCGNGDYFAATWPPAPASIPPGPREHGASFPLFGGPIGVAPLLQWPDPRKPRILKRP